MVDLALQVFNYQSPSNQTTESKQCYANICSAGVRLFTEDNLLCFTRLSLQTFAKTIYKH